MKATHTEAHLQTLVQKIFRRWPALVGFAVHDEAELVISELEMQPWNAEAHELLGEVAGELLEFVDEEPEALGLLRGRTFARVLH